MSKPKLSGDELTVDAAKPEADQRTADPFLKAFYVRIGLAIRSRRIHLGMTQKELSRKIGSSFQLIQKYEYGSIEMPAYRLHQLARALSVKAGDLVAGERN